MSGKQNIGTTENAGLENTRPSYMARVENAGPIYTGGKSGTGKRGTIIHVGGKSETSSYGTPLVRVL